MRGWFTRTQGGSYRVGIWKSINKEAVLLTQKCNFQLCDGEKIRFWKDGWCSDNPLCVTLPKLYSIVSTKGAKVAEVWVSQRDNGEWDPKFVRTFNDLEVGEVRLFVETIIGRTFQPKSK